MKWPEKHTCHDPKRFRAAKGEWRPPRAKVRRGDGPDEYSPDIQPTRECDFCGSMHPGDLLDLLRGPRAIELEVADWKYGWPHKIYVSGIPNPLAGEMAIRGCRYYTNESGEPCVQLHEPTPEPATLTAKFYTEHLLDEGFDAEAFTAITDLIADRTNLRFVLDSEKRLVWRRVQRSPKPQESVQ